MGSSLAQCHVSTYFFIQCFLHNPANKQLQEAQLTLTTGSTLLAVNEGKKT